MLHDRPTEPALADTHRSRPPGVNVGVLDVNANKLDPAELQLLADNLPTLCWVANGDGYIVWYNRRWHEYCGTTPTEMEGWSWQSVHDPRVLPEVMERWTASIALGEPFEMTFPIRGADSNYRPFLTRVLPLKDQSGRVLRWFGTNTDVSAQLRAEQALNHSAAELDQVFQGMGEGFVLLGADFHIRRINDAGLRLDGRKRDEIVGRHILDVWPEAEGFPTWPLYQKVMAERHPGELTYRHLYNSHDVWLEVHAYPTRDGIAIFYRDVSEAKQADVAIRKSEEQFRAFAETVPNHVWAARPDGFLYWFNQQVYDYSGDAPGSLDGVTEWARLLHPDDLSEAAKSWAHTLMTGDAYETEFRIRRADGAYRWHLVRAKPVRTADGDISLWVGTNTDIDDQKHQADELAHLNETLEAQVTMRTHELMSVEEALRQSQKMEAVGQLTGGLAHDFNNLLTGVMGSLELLQTRLMQGRVAEADRYVAAARGAAKRAAALTHRLLAFSRRQTLDPKPIDVNRLVAGMAELIQRTVGPEIAIEAVASVGLWTTLVDSGQLENALLNLCINARDAMPDGGKLMIETSNRWLDERAAREREIPPGQYISLCVTDTGTGMPADVVSRAFDPYFTTKPIGMGTGLGLSMIYGFVRQSGGQARIYSEEGKGTTVCLYLPRHVGELEPVEALAEISRVPLGQQTNKTVLIVDDEPMVRMLVADVLAELGYTTLEAADGPAGLRILNSDSRIDLLVTDVGLPGGVNGRQVADAARALRPTLKVLFITGYAENAVLNHGHLEKGMHVLTKPFAMETLASRIEDLIAKD